MPALSPKTKQVVALLAKIVVVSGAFYFIYSRLKNDGQLNWAQFSSILQQQKPIGLIIIILLLTFLNRFLEILKWKNLAGTIKRLSTGKAAEQVLAAVTAAIFTPNGIGEYAAKALYYRREQAKAVIFLNLICNGIQLIIAFFLGIVGLIVFNKIHNVVPTSVLMLITGVITAAVLALFLSRSISIKGYSLKTIATRINQLPKSVHRKNNLLALCRYLAIIHQHYFIFLMLGVHLPYYLLLPTIAAVYFIGSSLPSFQFLDFAVRGSVAVYFFGLLGVDEWLVVFAATLQWLLNIVLPVTIGSYFVFRFKPLNTNSTIQH